MNAALKPETLTQQRLMELFIYDPLTGLFTRKVSQSNAVKAGQLAGAPNGLGYLTISIDQRRYVVHRLAWLYVHGSFPAAFLDHINGERDDNRIVNLREATRSQNNANRPPGKNCNSGQRGVYWHPVKKLWMAAAGKDGRIIHLGGFKEFDAAKAAYQQAADGLHGEFAFDRRGAV